MFLQGVEKGHYQRLPVSVTLPESGAVCVAQCYFLKSTPGMSSVGVPDDTDAAGMIDPRLPEAECMSEYSPEQQRELYKPIRHIQVKQMLYLGESTGHRST